MYCLYASFTCSPGLLELHPVSHTHTRTRTRTHTHTQVDEMTRIKRQWWCVFSGIPYRVVIIPMKKLSIAMATVNPWVCVSGELGDSGVRQIPKNTQEIFFQVCTHTHTLLSYNVNTACNRASP